MAKGNKANESASMCRVPERDVRLVRHHRSCTTKTEYFGGSIRPAFRMQVYNKVGFSEKHTTSCSRPTSA
jgi:hypothetical protein